MEKAHGSAHGTQGRSSSHARRAERRSGYPGKAGRGGLLPGDRLAPREPAGCDQEAALIGETAAADTEGTGHLWAGSGSQRGRRQHGHSEGHSSACGSTGQTDTWTVPPPGGSPSESPVAERPAWSWGQESGQAPTATATAQATPTAGPRPLHRPHPLHGHAHRTGHARRRFCIPAHCYSDSSRQGRGGDRGGAEAPLCPQPPPVRGWGEGHARP